MKTKSQVILVLPESTKRMARMSAAGRGQSLSDYIEELVQEDCQENGIGKIVEKEIAENGIN